jgi:hypothetical protein
LRFVSKYWNSDFSLISRPTFMVCSRSDLLLVEQASMTLGVFFAFAMSSRQSRSISSNRSLSSGSWMRMSLLPR